MAIPCYRQFLLNLLYFARYFGVSLLRLFIDFFKLVLDFLSLLVFLHLHNISLQHIVMCFLVFLPSRHVINKILLLLLIFGFLLPPFNGCSKYLLVKFFSVFLHVFVNQHNDVFFCQLVLLELLSIFTIFSLLGYSSLLKQ